VGGKIWLFALNAAAAKLLVEADQAAIAQDFERAQALLRKAAEAQPDDASILLKLAGICRMAGNPRAALDAVHGALAISPLDFTALLLKASLLERLGVPGFGEAYGRALAQRPSGELPIQLAQIVAHAEVCHAEHVAYRDSVLTHAMASAFLACTPDEQRKINRFRTNALRKTCVFHSQPTHFHFPGLLEREFHDNAAFTWLDILESAVDTIAAEFAAVAKAERAELVPYIQYAAHEPLDQWRDLNHSRDWTAIHLLQNGKIIEANAKHCPQTMKILKQIPQPRIAGCSPNAMFSLLAPNTTIPPHTGVSNTRLVCHLPLIVPIGCWFRVGAERRDWKRGEAFVFDDTIEHEAANPSDELRVVFIIDVWHPGLSTNEREAVRVMMEADANSAALSL
jgi:aspartyl/asparaginyl beta-hydroxylase (cupin superfamily)